MQLLFREKPAHEVERNVFRFSFSLLRSENWCNDVTAFICSNGAEKWKEKKGVHPTVIVWHHN
jgi:hypothetical protein